MLAVPALLVAGLALAQPITADHDRDTILRLGDGVRVDICQYDSSTALLAAFDNQSALRAQIVTALERESFTARHRHCGDHRPPGRVECDSSLVTGRLTPLELDLLRQRCRGTRPPRADLDCADFPLRNGRTAQQQLNLDPRDPHDLDPDHNGIACDGGTTPPVVIVPTTPPATATPQAPVTIENRPQAVILNGSTGSTSGYSGTDSAGGSQTSVYPTGAPETGGGPVLTWWERAKLAALGIAASWMSQS